MFDTGTFVGEGVGWHFAIALPSYFLLGILEIVNALYQIKVEVDVAVRLLNFLQLIPHVFNLLRDKKWRVGSFEKGFPKVFQGQGQYNFVHRLCESIKGWMLVKKSQHFLL